MTVDALLPELLRRTHACWSAPNYLSVGQIYLYDNPLLKRPPRLTDVNPPTGRHRGTTAGKNFIAVQMNRVIKQYRPVA